MILSWILPHFIPISVLGATQGDIQPDELNALFYDFSASLDQTNSPHTSGVLYGTFPAACHRYFHSEEVRAPQGSSCQNAVGIRIKDDNGAFRKCVKHKNTQGRGCKDGVPCVRLSQVIPAFSFAANPSADFKLVFEDRSKDQDRYQCAHFGTETLHHKGQDEIDAEEREKEEKKRNAKINALKAQISSSTCLNDIDSSRTQNSSLLRLNIITQDIFNQHERDLQKKEKDIERMQLNEIQKKIQTAPVEILTQVREELMEWATEKEERSSDAIKGLMVIARRYTQEQPLQFKNLNLAEQTLAKGETLPGRKSALLKAYKAEIQQIRNLASPNPGLLTPPFMSSPMGITPFVLPQFPIAQPMPGFQTGFLGSFGPNPLNPMMIMWPGFPGSFGLHPMNFL